MVGLDEGHREIFVPVGKFRGVRAAKNDHRDPFAADHMGCHALVSDGDPARKAHAAQQKVHRFIIVVVSLFGEQRKDSCQVPADFLVGIPILIELGNWELRVY